MNDLLSIVLDDPLFLIALILAGTGVVLSLIGGALPHFDFPRAGRALKGLGGTFLSAALIAVCAFVVMALIDVFIPTS